jgi:hypothetical protein
MSFKVYLEEPLATAVKNDQTQAQGAVSAPGDKSAAFIDEKELRRRLPVSRRTVHNWRAAGKIPSIVIGRRVLFCWDSVSAALRRMERGGQQ